MNIVLPHGVLFRGGDEGKIRKNLIEKNHIDAIIGLPANIFYGTGIPTIVMVLKRKRKNTDVLMIDASKGFVKEGKNNKLRASDIKKIVDVVTRRESLAKFSRVVSRDEIRKNDYNLNLPRYVDTSEQAESWDIFASMFGGLPLAEIEALNAYWAAFPTLRNSLFTQGASAYCHFTCDDVKKAIKGHRDIEAFAHSFHEAFRDFDAYLYDELITNMERIMISKTEEMLAENIFQRLAHIPLIDKCEAYQLLDDDWTKIAIDLEMIQTEGFEATKVVDPNMVVKKKGALEQEVQEGWKGRILPFSLVQESLLSDEKQAIEEKEKTLSEIAAQYEEIFDTLTEEEKEQDFVHEDGWAFAEVAKARKNKDMEPETQAKINAVAELNTKEKALKAEVKRERARLEAKTKETIEHLSDEQVKELLKRKWIHPLLARFMELPESAVSALIAKLETLAKKYETTFAEMESQIEETQRALSAMMDDMEGNEFDMRGLREFKKLLGGESSGRNQ